MALEALATDVIKSLGEKLFSAAVKEILFAADTESHIKSLANTKAMIEAVLLDGDASTQVGRSRVQRLELEKLSRDSWVLFQRAALPHEGQVEQGLKEIGQEILERCPKVPLVIRAIRGLLREQEPTKDKWQAFRDGPLQDLSSAVPDVMESLKLSYAQLDPRLKLFFAYCSLFPRGWKFDKDELIRLWIALGYVEAHKDVENLLPLLPKNKENLRSLLLDFWSNPSELQLNGLSRF
ncbi:hypothetical protein Cgig2_007960 [Carnegiea gigantea]|uniref:Disease resistance protein winged helix domain-containing protein n=1 Tax=Carnegiea gigantea TaxID=171969 RepID=A0A9Q1QH98_9CARY|nr:hypothetical protein Cgig2_007960 [Carnegiea gigantea]